MESVLVTGADGFVGRHVVAALRLRGVRVLAAPRAATDLLDPAGRRALIEAERPEGLIHLAWVTEHGKFWSSAENVSWREASGDLFDLFFAAGGRRAVGAGSCAEYDWSGETARIREDAPLAPHSIYGKAKAETAEALMTTAARHGGSAAWGRLFFLFGDGRAAGATDSFNDPRCAQRSAARLRAGGNLARFLGRSERRRGIRRARAPRRRRTGQHRLRAARLFRRDRRHDREFVSRLKRFSLRRPFTRQRRARYSRSGHHPIEG